MDYCLTVVEVVGVHTEFLELDQLLDVVWKNGLMCTYHVVRDGSIDVTSMEIESAKHNPGPDHDPLVHLRLLSILHISNGHYVTNLSDNLPLLFRGPCQF
jgi:hypothetical protein